MDGEARRRTRDPAGGLWRHPHHEGFDGFGPEAVRGRPGIKWARRGGDDVIAAWVADMDFAPCPAVLARLHELLAEGDLGYPDWPHGTPLRRVFVERMADRYGWEPDAGAVREVTDLIQAVQVVIHLATRRGDAVAIHTPAYPPFLRSVTDAGRRLVPVPMDVRDGRWTFDPARLDRDVAAHAVRVLLLVNPHNPTGRVFTVAELESLADVARRHDLLVVSDEIHAELAYAPHRHVPFATLSADAARRTVTLTSASKAFNLAGLRCAVAHVGSARLLAAHDAQPSDLFGAANLFGVHAALAAWSAAARPWQERLLAHLAENRRQVAEAMAGAVSGLAGVRLVPPEATYLAWLDVRDVGVGRPGADGDQVAQAFQAAGVRLSPGEDFGPGGEGFVRLNFATSAQVLAQALGRMAAVTDGG